MSESFEAGPARGQYYVPYEASAEGVGSSYSEKGFALQEVLAPFKLKLTGQNNEIVSKRVATLQVTQIEGKGSQETMLALKAPTVDLLSDKSIETHVGVKQKGSVFEKTITHQEVAHSNEIQGLTLRIEADYLDGVDPTLIDAVLDLQASLIKLISQDAFEATLQTIVHKQVVGSSIDPGLAMVVGLATTIATLGTSTAFVAGFLEVAKDSIVATMGGALMASVASQGAVSLLANQGNVSHVLKDITSSSSLKSIAIDTLTAGLVGKGGTLASLDLLQHAKVQSLRSLVRAGLNVAIQGEDLESALQDMLKSALKFKLSITDFVSFFLFFVRNFSVPFKKMVKYS